jgi:hypothetical protein
LTDFCGNSVQRSRITQQMHLPAVGKLMVVEMWTRRIDPSSTSTANPPMLYNFYEKGGGLRIKVYLEQAGCYSNVIFKAQETGLNKYPPNVHITTAPLTYLVLYCVWWCGCSARDRAFCF